ncbi:hypothetical protein LCGC14_2954370 [marine sediment metagenome]|uniref:Uncharacterized protein n=1 Tax=marine sediment metagenome TaxID=412755 RepID=A0A0F8XEY6_9ZZZZ
MVEEDQTGKTPEDAKKPEGGEDQPDAPAEGGEDQSAEGDAPAEGAEAPAEAEAKAAELKGLKGRLEATEKELAEIKALLKKPVHKSIAQTKDPSVGEEKAKEPLDVI